MNRPLVKRGTRERERRSLHFPCYFFSPNREPVHRLLFCSLVHRLAVRISLPFYIFCKLLLYWSRYITVRSGTTQQKMCIKFPFHSYRFLVINYELTTFQGRLAKNILRLRELVTIFSKQENVVLEQKWRVLLSSEGFMQPGPGLMGTFKCLFGTI